MPLFKRNAIVPAHNGQVKVSELPWHFFVHRIVAALFFSTPVEITNTDEKCSMSVTSKNSLARGREGFDWESIDNFTQDADSIRQYFFLAPKETIIIYLPNFPTFLLEWNFLKLEFFRRTDKEENKYELILRKYFWIYLKEGRNPKIVMSSSFENEHKLIPEIPDPENIVIIDGKDDAGEYLAYKHVPVENGSKPWTIDALLQAFEVYYSEAAVLYLALYTICSTFPPSRSALANGIVLLAFAFYTMMFNAVRKNAAYSFHDINKWLANGKQLHELDCLPNAASFCVPMIISGLGSVLLTQTLSTRPISLTNLIATSTGFGYLVVGLFSVQICFYSIIYSNMIPQSLKDIRIVNFCIKIAVFGGLGLIVLGILGVVIYVGLKPFPAVPYILGAICCVLFQAVLGSKAILITYGFSNLGEHRRPHPSITTHILRYHYSLKLLTVFLIGILGLVYGGFCQCVALVSATMTISMDDIKLFFTALFNFVTRNLLFILYGTSFSIGIISIWVISIKLSKINFSQ